MASADFSQPILRHCCRRTPVPRRGWEISQGKTLILHSVAAGFTCARVCLNIGRPGPWPSYPTAPASYPVPVRQLRALPPASSPPRLAATQLPLASGSVQPARRGLAPPTSTPCLAHQKRAVPRGAALSFCQKPVGGTDRIRELITSVRRCRQRRGSWPSALQLLPCSRLP